MPFLDAPRSERAAQFVPRGSKGGGETEGGRETFGAYQKGWR